MFSRTQCLCLWLNKTGSLNSFGTSFLWSPLTLKQRYSLSYVPSFISLSCTGLNPENALCHTEFDTRHLLMIEVCFLIACEARLPHTSFIVSKLSGQRILQRNTMDSMICIFSVDLGALRAYVSFPLFSF